MAVSSFLMRIDLFYILAVFIVVLQTCNPPAADNSPAALSSDDDIPAVDANVKDLESPLDVKKVGVQEETRKAQKDPKDDPVGWVSSLIPGAGHKVNYQLLNWAQQLAVGDEKRQGLPGKNNAVTKKQFLSFLRDGTLLAKLANVLEPGTVETVYEGDAAKDKVNQESNIKAFISFAKDKAGLSDDQVFTVADLQDRGKTGYNAVFNTLMQLGLKTKTTFGQKGIEMEQLVQQASQVVQTNLIQTILGFFRRARPTQTPKKLAKEAEEKEKVAAAVEKVHFK
ncbi:unnamed protein product [Thelazia callipaeda]|uniref:Calponin-homology (CH) domain-containing protein n=1 Tax=Thelazia callipaeda TaxID=103827 RepID=A0A0N5D1J9_THECL|nr:unnamed protein product [Thelazia callipaeda]